MKGVHVLAPVYLYSGAVFREALAELEPNVWRIEKGGRNLP